MCGTPPWIWSACYGARISQMFWKIAVWMQSATDDPGFCFLLSSHGTSDSPPMKGFNCWLVYSEYIKGSRSSRMLICVWGIVCSLRVRGLSRRRH